jgi:uncharacterized membrane protein YtjA (UPF0391 family)
MALPARAYGLASLAFGRSSPRERARHDFRNCQSPGGGEMLKLALTFFLIGLVAAVLGFTGIAGASFAIAKIFALIFGVLFLLFLVLGLSAANRLAT